MKVDEREIQKENWGYYKPHIFEWLLLINNICKKL